MTATALTRRAALANGLALSLASPLAAVSASRVPNPGNELSAALEAFRAAVARRDACFAENSVAIRALTRPKVEGAARDAWWEQVASIEATAEPFCADVHAAAGVLAVAPCRTIRDLEAKVTTFEADGLLPDADDFDDLQSRSLAAILRDIRTLAGKAVANV